jgi:hypothetical protein
MDERGPRARLPAVRDLRALRSGNGQARRLGIELSGTG